MNVIVFKKKEENDKYDTELSKHFKPIFIPVLDHTLVNLEQLIEIFCHEASHQGIILTSQRSVEALSRVPKIHTSWYNLPYYLVGDQTAESLSRIIPRQTNWVIEPKAADLIGHLKTGPILFLAGDKRREVIPDDLKQKGIQFDEIETYRTCGHPEIKRELDRLRGIRPDGIVLFSPSGYRFLMEGGGEWVFWSGLKVVSIGPTTTEAIEWDNVWTAERPDAVHVLKALLDAFKV